MTDVPLNCARSEERQVRRACVAPTCVCDPYVSRGPISCTDANAIYLTASIYNGLPIMQVFVCEKTARVLHFMASSYASTSQGLGVLRYYKNAWDYYNKLEWNVISK